MEHVVCLFWSRRTVAMFAGLIGFLRKSFNKDEYRVLGTYAVLGALVGAALGFAATPKPALGFAAVPRWLTAAIVAVGSIPVSLAVGVWFVLMKRTRQLSSQMTATAYRLGAKNALACGVGVLVVWLLVWGIVWRATGKTIGESFGIAFALLFGVVFVWFLAGWLYGRQAAGQVLLDCGPHPSRRLFLLNAVPALVVGLIAGGSVIGSVSEVLWVKVFWIAILVLTVSSGVDGLIMAGGRLQVRENGVWQYCGLLRWSKIKSYQWANDGTWLVRVKGFSFLRRGALPVPPEYKDAFDQLLQKHCAAEAGERA